MQVTIFLPAQDQGWNKLIYRLLEDAGWLQGNYFITWPPEWQPRHSCSTLQWATIVCKLSLQIRQAWTVRPESHSLSELILNNIPVLIDLMAQRDPCQFGRRGSWLEGEGTMVHLVRPADSPSITGTCLNACFNASSQTGQLSHLSSGHGDVMYLEVRCLPDLTSC